MRATPADTQTSWRTQFGRLPSALRSLHRRWLHRCCPIPFRPRRATARCSCWRRSALRAASTAPPSWRSSRGWARATTTASWGEEEWAGGCRAGVRSMMYRGEEEEETCSVKRVCTAGRGCCSQTAATWDTSCMPPKLAVGAALRRLPLRTHPARHPAAQHLQTLPCPCHRYELEGPYMVKHLQPAPSRRRRRTAPAAAAVAAAGGAS